MAKEQTKNWPLYIGLLCAIYLVFNVGNEFRSECYQIIPEAKDTRQILLDKCTGDSWMLVYTQIVDEKGAKTGEFTYRWNKLVKDYSEAMLSRQKL